MSSLRDYNWNQILNRVGEMKTTLFGLRVPPDRLLVQGTCYQSYWTG